MELSQKISAVDAGLIIKAMFENYNQIKTNSNNVNL
jgi:hypothetical protein